MTDFLLFENALNEYKKITTDNNDKLKTDDKFIEEDIDNFDDTELIRYRKLSYSSVEDKNSLDDLSENSTCKHKNISNENSCILCLDCGKELEKSIFQDKEWRYYGQSDNK